MSILSYIIWNANPEIFSVGTFALRWYGLFFALGFLVSQQILYYMYKKEGKPEKDVETLTIYMVVATIIGARLGHVIFYQPEIIWEEPESIFLPFEFNPFRFTGLQGLASHGGAIAILIAIWLYCYYKISFRKPAGTTKRKLVYVEKRYRPGQSWLQVLDRIVILVALTGAFIRFGNYFNSEIIGKPTDGKNGVIFVSKLTEALKEKKVADKPAVESVLYQRNDSLPAGANGRIPLSIYIFFQPGVDEQSASRMVAYGVSDLLVNRLYEFFDQPTFELDYEITTDKNGNLAARINTFGIARHPAQLYESISCLLLFFWLLWLWARHRENLPAGRLFGIFLIVCFGLRILYEFLKEPQVSFETELPLYMGQILSIPLLLAGVFILIRSYREPKAQNSAVV